MKLLFFSDNFYPEMNAIASRVHERAKYWVRWGHEVTVITSTPNFPEGKVFVGYRNDWYRVEMIDGIRVVRVKTFIAKNKGLFLRTLDFLSYIVPAICASFVQKKADIVIATSPQFFVAVTGWIVASIRRRPFVFEVADLWPASIGAVGAIRNRFILRTFEFLELFLYWRAKAIIALTRSYKTDIVRRGIDEKKIYTIQNGVDLERYSPRVRDKELARELHIEDSFIVGYIGTHGMAHGLEQVLDTAELMQSEETVRFLFVGTGAARNSLIARTQERRLHNVIFVPVQPKERIPVFWSLCDVALVHLKDTAVFKTVIPSKIFEAMGMSIPILLVAPEGEASQFVCEEGVGLWVKPGNPSLLREAIMQLKDTHVRDRIRSQSISRASFHTREQQARAMCQIFLEL